MKDEPDIIKKLREEEKLGKLRKQSFSQELNILQKNEERIRNVIPITNFFLIFIPPFFPIF